MKITFEETLSRKEWIHTELLNSLTGDLITKAADDGFYDVKLLVNGVEVEPVLFNKLVNNVTRYIDEQAKSLLRDKLEDAENAAYRLTEIVNAAKNNIVNDFNLNEKEIYRIVPVDPNFHFFKKKTTISKQTNKQMI